MTELLGDYSSKPKNKNKPRTAASPKPGQEAAVTTLLTPELLSEKLQDSVSMLKDAMDSNKKLRASMNDLVQSNRLLKADNN